MNGDLSIFNNPTWSLWKFKVKVQLQLKRNLDDDENESNGNCYNICSVADQIMACMSLLHIAILCHDIDQLSQILNLLETRVWMADPVFLIIPKKFKNVVIAEEDAWINGATCYHLAARFNPNGLHLLLSQLEENSDTFLEIYKNGKTSPLHVAASNTDELAVL